LNAAFPPALNDPEDGLQPTGDKQNRGYARHQKMNNKIAWFHWLPRILCIAAILFISMFALDSFGTGEPVWRQVLAFIIHLIPVYIIVAILVLAWNYEKIGGIAFIGFGLLTTPLIFMHNYAINNSVWVSLSIILMITLPFVLVGGLFLLSHHMKKRRPLII
jgi:hypothetical protein